MGMFANQALIDFIFRMKQQIKIKKEQKRQEKERKDQK